VVGALAYVEACTDGDASFEVFLITRTPCEICLYCQLLTYMPTSIGLHLADSIVQILSLSLISALSAQKASHECMLAASIIAVNIHL
jgi:hypothetical protein